MDRVKTVIPCKSCELCAIGYECGFTGRMVMRCSHFDVDVTRDDGCTMGEYGSSGTLGSVYDVTVSGHETVWGFNERV